MVLILYTRFEQALDPLAWKYHLNKLPLDLQEKVKGFRHWQDRHSHLFSKLLLQEAIQLFNLKENGLENLKYSSYGRPFLNSTIDFNISHSGQYVLCVIAQGIQVGIDIEEIKTIDFTNFNNLFRPDELAFINGTAESIRAFYDYWSIKESVIKAEGRGLSIPLKDIYVSSRSATLYNKIWYINELKLDTAYSAHLTSNVYLNAIQLHEICYYK